MHTACVIPVLDDFGLHWSMFNYHVFGGSPGAQGFDMF